MASQADPAPAILTADAIPTLANMYARGTLPTLDPDTTPQPLANCSPAINARVALVDHDITRMAVDAIVNAAANGLGAGGGICGAIHAVAGPAFTKHCLTLGGCNTGDAKITPGFDLPAKHVIHTPGPDCRTGIQMQKADSLLDSSYHACLSLAASHRLDTLVFCPISTGIFAFPPGRAVEIALARVRKFLEHPAAVWPRTIVFTNTHRGLYQLYLRRLPVYFPASPGMHPPLPAELPAPPVARAATPPPSPAPALDPKPKKRAALISSRNTNQAALARHTTPPTDSATAQNNAPASAKPERKRVKISRNQTRVHLGLVPIH